MCVYRIIFLIFILFSFVNFLKYFILIFCLDAEVLGHSAGGSYVCTSSRAHTRKYAHMDETRMRGKHFP